MFGFLLLVVLAAVVGSLFIAHKNRNAQEMVDTAVDKAKEAIDKINNVVK